MAAEMNIGCVRAVESWSCSLGNATTGRADLALLPEVPHIMVSVIVTWPLGAVHGDSVGEMKTVEGFCCSVLHSVYVFLMYHL
jgi:hypothetical protein